MAHAAQRRFVELASLCLPTFFENTSVLEIGSLNLGQTVRDYFKGCNYIGLDVDKGEGVDIVCQGQNYAAPDGSYRHVISCEAMEHNPYWKETFANMIRLCEPGGLITMTCATTGRGEHGTTRSDPTSSPLSTGIGWDYYHNLTADDFRRTFQLKESFLFHHFWYNWYTFDLYFLGIRAGLPPSQTLAGDWNQTVETITKSLEESNRPFPIKLRKAGAMLGGDQLFIQSRKMHEKLNYLLNVTG